MVGKEDKNMMTLNSLALAIYTLNNEKYVDISDLEYDNDSFEELISLLLGLKIPLNPLASAIYILDKENHVDVSGFENKDELLEVIKNILKGFKIEYEISESYVRIFE